MKIYTKRGDEGQTDLFGGGRVSKDHPRVLAYGAVDSANAAVGFAYACEDLPKSIKMCLPEIMSDLFDVGAELATAPTHAAQQTLNKRLQSRVDQERIESLESLIDETQEQLEPLQHFILPTGVQSACRLHLARVSVRHAEQMLVALQKTGEHVAPQLLAYMNRLSDLLFVWARKANQEADVSDIKWVAKRP